MSDTEKHVYQLKIVSNVSLTDEELREEVFMKFLEHEEFQRFVMDWMVELADAFVIIA